MAGYLTDLNAIIVIFEATKPWSIQDWIEDIDYVKIDYKKCNKC